MLSKILFCALIYVISPEIKTNALFISEYCPPCEEAKKLVPSNTIIIDIHKYPILANHYKVRTVSTYLIIKNSQVIKRLVGLAAIQEYCNYYSQDSFSGVIYFDGPDNTLTLGIKRRIKRLGFTIKNGNPQDAIDYKITHLPTFIFIENGKELGRYIGTKLI